MPQDDLEQLSLDVYHLARQEVLVHLRFLNGACALLRPYPKTGSTLATDGSFVRFDPSALVALWKQEPSLAARSYLHMVLHNAFLHTYPGVVERPLAWDVACDVAVEAVIADLGVPALATTRANAQQAALLQLAGEARHLTAESLYRHFVEHDIDDEVLEALRLPFATDDHTLWHEAAVASEHESAMAAAHEAPSGSSAQDLHSGNQGADVQAPDGHTNQGKSRFSQHGIADESFGERQTPENARLAQQGRMANTINLNRSRRQWEDAALEMGVQLDSYVRLFGTQGSALSMSLANVTRRKQDYRSFLRRFATRGENIRINDDEFDYVHYCYGLSLYGNLPLIEPLEYAEEKRIRELVIAIDTSASTKEGLVKRFVEQTYQVLGNTSSFFEDSRVVVMQCDAEVTSEVSIRSMRDFERYLDNLHIEGLGGTDFRPVFARIEQMRDTGELRELAGLLYFTDGFGSYPRTPPSYRCAFVFADAETEQAAKVPTWAMKVALDDDLRTGHGAVQPRLPYSANQPKGRATA